MLKEDFRIFPNGQLIDMSGFAVSTDNTTTTGVIPLEDAAVASLSFGAISKDRGDMPIRQAVVTLDASAPTLF